MGPDAVIVLRVNGGDPRVFGRNFFYRYVTILPRALSSLDILIEELRILVSKKTFWRDCRGLVGLGKRVLEQRPIIERRRRPRCDGSALRLPALASKPKLDQAADGFGARLPFSLRCFAKTRSIYEEIERSSSAAALCPD
jgi:hypothetical protein